MSLVLFDIDGTLLDASSERLFARYLWHRGLLGGPQLRAFLRFVLRYGLRFGHHTLKKNKAYLAGLERDMVSALAACFVDEYLIPRLSSRAMHRLRAHLRQGDEVVLLTGTLDFIARPLAKRLGAQHVEATVCAEHDGVFLPQPPLRHPLGKEKLERARELSERLALPLATTVAYADARDDRHLLKAVGHPVAVSPDLPLWALAKRSGWEILDGATP